MVKKALTKKFSSQSTNFAVYDLDENDSINSVGVDVDDGNYDNGTFKDRDYDVRNYKSLAINLENIGANAVKYKILSTNKNFSDLDSDLSDDDFDKEEKAETSLSPRSKATGSVVLTGGPSVAASGTLTIASAVANTFATGTVTAASVQAGDTVTIDGKEYTAVSGPKNDNTEFSVDTGDNECAADLADSFNNDARPGTLGNLSAVAVANEVTVTTDVEGVAGNAVTLVSSNGTRLAVSGSGTLTGGVDADVATVDGLDYTAVSGTKADFTQFSIDDSDTAAGIDLADSINNDTRPKVTEPDITIVATQDTGVVTITADINAGADGNGIDISGTSHITASAANLENGVSASMDSITVDGQEILSGSVPFRDDLATTASDIKDNINAVTTNPNYTATVNSATVTIIAAVNEPSTAAVVSTTTTLTKTDNNMSGGAGGKADTLEIVRNSPSITAIRLRAKESSAGQAGKIRADIKGSER